MKTTAFLAAMAAALLFSISISAQTVDLLDALKKGLVTISVAGTGGHQGESLKMTLHNKSKKKLTVRIPAGQVFEPVDSNLQNLMVAKEEQLLVEAGKNRIAKLFGFCVEAGDGSPGESTFNFGALAEGPLLKLAQYLSENKLYQNGSAQYAVWAVSNNYGLESIGDQTLTKFVADLLGKPMPAYSLTYSPPQPEDRLLPGQPVTLPEAVSMNGLFYYELTKDQIVGFGLYNEQGELVHTLFKNRQQKKGHHKFRFEFEIRNLPKGKYYARLVSERKVIKELEASF